MNKLQVIKGIECYEDENGIVQLKLEDICWGLGFTKTENKNGKEYASIRWERVKRYMKEIGIPFNQNGYLSIEDTLKLSKKANNTIKNNFIDIVCEIGRIQKPIIKIDNRFETKFFGMLKDILNELTPKGHNYVILEQVNTRDNKYRVDCYIPEVELVIEYDEEQHKYQASSDITRQLYIEELGLYVIRVDKGNEGSGIGNIIKYIFNYQSCNEPKSESFMEEHFSPYGININATKLEDINNEHRKIAYLL